MHQSGCLASSASTILTSSISLLPFFVALLQEGQIPEAYALEDWLWKIGCHPSLSSELLKYSLHTEALRKIDPRVLNDILKEANLPIVDRTKILANLEDITPPPDSLNFQTGAASTGKELFFWLYAVIAGLFFVALPIVLIVWADDLAKENDSGANGATTLLYNAVVPGSIVFVLAICLTPSLSMLLTTDTVQERSLGVDFKAAAETQLTNTGIVGALMLTMVLACLQADLPEDEKKNGYRSVIGSWYIIFLIMSLFFSVTSTVLSSLCLMYIHPLSGDAVDNWISIMALYLGEPVNGTIWCLVFILDAMCLWVWASYGREVGIFGLCVIWFLFVRILVTLQNLMYWENPCISQEERERRVKVVDRQNNAADENRVLRRNSQHKQNPNFAPS